LELDHPQGRLNLISGLVIAVLALGTAAPPWIRQAVSGLRLRNEHFEISFPDAGLWETATVVGALVVASTYMYFCVRLILQYDRHLPSRRRRRELK
jgi:hypothetical protein